MFIECVLLADGQPDHEDPYPDRWTQGLLHDMDRARGLPGHR